MAEKPVIITGITGATGAPFARDFILRCPGSLHVVASTWGKRVFRDETGETIDQCVEAAGGSLIDDTKLNSRFCSGGASVDAMVIIPCSSSTLGKIANGYGDTVMTRAAHVTLKERRTLILCLRETPLSAIDLENALRLSRAGAIIMPLMPMWYFNPQSLEELIQAFTDRVIALCGGPPGKVWPEGRS